MKSFKRTIVSLGMTLLLMLFGCFGIDAKAATNLEVHIIDVGQADSIYIKLPNGENMLIDAGNNDDGTTVVNYLENEGVTKINYLVGTHPHEDHIGGLDDVIENFDIGKVYMPSKTSTTQTYKDVITAIANKGLTITSAKKGVIILNTTANGKTLSANILSPTGTTTYSEVNDYSAVIRLVYGANSFLFTGDAGEIPEAAMISSGQTITADVLKVGHHGSSTASSEAFLDAVNPTDAVISVGTGNSYGHPHQVTIDALKERNINIFRTDIQGTIIYTSDGTSYQTNVTAWWQG